MGHDYVTLLLNPIFLGMMVAAGIAYGAIFLWAVNIRDCVRLYMIAVVPGIAFLVVVAGVRLFQGATSAGLYSALVLDWMIFANAGFWTVIARRWILGRMRRR
jgi:hypothetical protein